jgi:hypothetical protein
VLFHDRASNMIVSGGADGWVYLFQIRLRHVVLWYSAIFSDGYIQALFYASTDCVRDTTAQTDLVWYCSWLSLVLH